MEPQPLDRRDFLRRPADDRPSLDGGDVLVRVEAEADEVAEAADRALAEATADGMRRILDDPRLAEELRIKGLKRAREFSWERSVEKTQRVYREVAADGHASEMEHLAG